MKYFIGFVFLLFLAFNSQAQKSLIKKAKKWYNKAEVSETSRPRYENHWGKAYVIDSNTVIVPNSIVGLVQQNKNLDLYWFTVFEFNQKEEIILAETLQIISRSKINDVSLVLKNRKSDNIEDFEGSLIFQDLKKENPPRGLVYKSGVRDINARSETRAVRSTRPANVKN